MLGELITSKTRLRLLIKFFISQANKGHLNGLATEMGESTNGIRKELNHLEDAGYLQKFKVYYPNYKSELNLENWNNFEIKFPETFLSMYQFWVSRI